MSLWIEMFSTLGCSSRARTRDALKAVVETFDRTRVSWREVNVLDEIEYAISLGVLTPPCIAIDGKLAFPALLTPERLREELASRLTHGT